MIELDLLSRIEFWCLLATVIVIALSSLTYTRMRGYRRSLERLQQQLDVFVDASISVAHSVDAMAYGSANSNPTKIVSVDLPEEERSVASRRWLLEEAHQRLGQGAKIADVAQALGLHKDEVRILKVLHHPN